MKIIIKKGYRSKHPELDHRFCLLSEKIEADGSDPFRMLELLLLCKLLQKNEEETKKDIIKVRGFNLFNKALEMVIFGKPLKEIAKICHLDIKKAKNYDEQIKNIFEKKQTVLTMR